MEFIYTNKLDLLPIIVEVWKGRLVDLGVS
jgi:hypothetical protein